MRQVRPERRLPRFLVRWSDDVQRIVHAASVADARAFAASLYVPPGVVVADVWGIPDTAPSRQAIA
jgi:hypothetical protein